MIQRYKGLHFPAVAPDDDGEYVLYDDYSLEVNLLKYNNSQLSEQIRSYQDMIYGD